MGELGDGELEGLDGGGETLGVGFAEEEMDVFGHDDVAHDLDVVSGSCGFEGREEEVSGFGGVEVGETVVTAEGDEVVVAFLLVSAKASGMEGL